MLSKSQNERQSNLCDITNKVNTNHTLASSSLTNSFNSKNGMAPISIIGEDSKLLREMHKRQKNAGNQVIGSMDLRPIDTGQANNKPEKGKVGVSICASKDLSKDKPSLFMERFDGSINVSVNSNVNLSQSIGLVPGNIMSSEENFGIRVEKEVTTPDNIVDLTVDSSNKVAKNLCKDFNKVTSAITFIKELPDVDRRDMMDSQTAAEQAVDIHNHCIESEKDFFVETAQMKKQTDINERMRGILVDWLVEVHLKFKLFPETLMLTVSTIDRQLEKRDVHRSKLQLVGVTTMLIACKQEEIQPPEVRDFVQITDRAQTAEEVLDMEVDILNTLEFNLTVPSALRFLDRQHKLLGTDMKTYMLARYFIELCLLDVRQLKWLPSRLAAGAIQLAVKINKKAHKEWTGILTSSSKCEEAGIRETAKMICSVLKAYGQEKASLQAIRKKFLLDKFCKVAKVELEGN